MKLLKIHVIIAYGSRLARRNLVKCDEFKGICRPVCRTLTVTALDSEVGQGDNVLTVKKAVKNSLVSYCDFMCTYAEVPKDAALDGSGSCRTFIAIYCNRRKTFVHKNLSCRQKQVHKDA